SSKTTARTLPTVRLSASGMAVITGWVRSKYQDYSTSHSMRLGFFVTNGNKSIKRQLRGNRRLRRELRRTDTSLHLLAGSDGSTLIRLIQNHSAFFLSPSELILPSGASLRCC